MRLQVFPCLKIVPFSFLHQDKDLAYCMNLRYLIQIQMSFRNPLLSGYFHYFDFQGNGTSWAMCVGDDGVQHCWLINNTSGSTAYEVSCSG